MATQYYHESKIKWPALIENGEHSIDQVSSVSITFPESDNPIKAAVELVFSNKYGPDDDISLRGVGMLFLNISSEDCTVIAEEVVQNIESMQMDSHSLQALEIIIIDEEEISS